MSRYKWYALIAYAIIVVVAFYGYQQMDRAQLSQKRLAELREIYPAYNADHPLYFLDKSNMTFENIIQSSSSVVVGEVISKLPEVEIDLFGNVGTPEYEINQKRQENNLPTSYATFTQYEIRRLEHIRGKQVDDILYLIHNADHNGIEPELKPGMKIVAALGEGTGPHEGKYWMTRFGMYYIVDDQYVLSTVEDEYAEQMNGRTLTYLKKKIMEM